MELGAFVFVIIWVLFILVFTIVPLVLLVWALVDMLKRPSWQWDASNQQQIVWVLVVLLIGLIGPLLYLYIARPKLDAVAANPPPFGPPPYQVGGY